jgi:nucleotide-binding universal stress UspA family protein
MFKTLLVPLDGTYLAERAVSYAVVLAQRLRARLVLYHNAPPGALEQRPDDERASALELETLAAEIRAKGVAVETVVDHAFHGEVGRTITEAARDRGADLVVMATHGRTELQDAFFGSAAERVVRDAGLPVLVIPANYDQPWSVDPDLRILVGLDDSVPAKPALEVARAIAGRSGGTLLLIRFIEPGSRDSNGQAQAAAMAEAQAQLEQIAGELRQAGLSVEVLVEAGDPKLGLAALAEARKVDLVVMSTHGRHGLSRLAIGSVTEATLRRATVPLLAVRTGGLQ